MRRLEDSEELRWQVFTDLRARSREMTAPFSREELLNYSIHGERLPLIDYSRGIRNVDGRTWHDSLAIVTSERGRYHDRSIAPGVWIYPYETLSKTGEAGSSNAKLEHARGSGAHVLYFYSPRKNVYLLVGLINVIGYDREKLEFTVALADLGITPATLSEDDADLRRWVRREVDARLHQPRFRQIVIPAYKNMCTVCSLPVPSLLEAAHIRPDKDLDWGRPDLENGLALCRNHHRAYDRHLLGIDGDGVIHMHDAVSTLEPSSRLDAELLDFSGKHIAPAPRGLDARRQVRLDLTYQEFLGATHVDLSVG
ncbi:HNH endonuclease [Demequina capsici]|uniref:HNH endonuclease n=1 Tax=Demequina capsici TaxID=3075620 RepID=A0AA96F417_9MICO|nr:HNH endonuclease [Demequina sp. OYTSA14]WNM23631.1 HNH endonuclease [Demequina sp. OYTSA14]